MSNNITPERGRIWPIRPDRGPCAHAELRPSHLIGYMPFTPCRKGVRYGVARPNRAKLDSRLRGNDEAGEGSARTSRLPPAREMTKVGTDRPDTPSTPRLRGLTKMSQTAIGAPPPRPLRRRGPPPMRLRLTGGIGPQPSWRKRSVLSRKAMGRWQPAELTEGQWAKRQRPKGRAERASSPPLSNTKGKGPGGGVPRRPLFIQAPIEPPKRINGAACPRSPEACRTGDRAAGWGASIRAWSHPRPSNCLPPSCRARRRRSGWRRRSASKAR